MVVLYVEVAFLRDACGSELVRPLLVDLSLLGRSDLLLWSLIGQLRTWCRRNVRPTTLEIEALATLFTTTLLRHCFRLQDSREKQLSPEQLRLVLDYIDRHVGEALTRERLARLVRLPQRVFGQRFKISVGLRTADYIMQRRTALALEQVDKGLLTKAAIAADYGFSDQSHLRRRIQRLRRDQEAAIDGASLRLGSDRPQGEGTYTPIRPQKSAREV